MKRAEGYVYLLVSPVRPYATALYYSTQVFFEGDFDAAREFLNLPVVRRAIVAYWTEALIHLQDKGSASVHSKNHNWNAVVELRKRIEAERL